MAEVQLSDRVRAELESVVGAPHVLVDRDRLAAYETDWTGRWHGSALLAVRPASTEEVAAVLSACGRERVGVVVQGGNTGLSGGATPLDGEVVLDTGRLDDLGEVDRRARQVSFGAGVTLEQAQAHARSAGLDVGIDFGARSRATVGGLVATNAGGAMAIRHGTMRARVAGLEAVLADGTVVSRLSGLPKDNAGYDLPALLIGSEGTLGVVTRVRVALVERPRRRAVGLLGVGGFEEGVDLVTRVRDRVGPALEAAECFDREGMEMVCAHREVQDPLPMPAPVYVLLQVADEEDAISVLASALDPEYLDAMVVGDDGERQEALWAYREELNEAAGANGVARKYDVSVPLTELATFSAAVREEVASLGPRARASIYGHLGDGNLHVNVFATADEDALDRSMVALVGAHRGSISAEHGVGRAKRTLLEPTRSAAEIEAMRRLKLALDPAQILGRDRVLPAPGAVQA